MRYPLCWMPIAKQGDDGAAEGADGPRTSEWLSIQWRIITEAACKVTQRESSKTVFVLVLPRSNFVRHD